MPSTSMEPLSISGVVPSRLSDLDTDIDFTPDSSSPGAQVSQSILDTLNSIATSYAPPMSRAPGLKASVRSTSAQSSDTATAAEFRACAMWTFTLASKATPFGRRTNTGPSCRASLRTRRCLSACSTFTTSVDIDVSRSTPRAHAPCVLPFRWLWRSNRLAMSSCESMLYGSPTRLLPKSHTSSIPSSL